MEVKWNGSSLGGLIALLVLVAAFVLLLMGTLKPVFAAMFMGLAIARLC